MSGMCRAKNKETGEICALKKVKLEKERDGFPLTSIREINILLSMHHPNIVNVSEVGGACVGGSQGNLGGISVLVGSEAVCPTHM
jgi:serine/threonine protein kinase